MHSGPSGFPDLSSPFKDDPQQPLSLTARFPTNVTTAAPAKRITFFKSGDAQFSGVRMAIHNRSFKCFDALLDDLSQKVPLPFGVRTITTPRGTHSIKRLEQLEDGGCYLCSDLRHVRPINMEVAGKRPTVWHHHSRPHSARRRPTRPEEAPPEHASPHYYRHPKRIVLVKNADPSVRRSIVLSRRTARSLRVFMEEVSELMQCHIKKLYTIEGRKIDSIQTLMHCPNVLVCVGREPFRPLMVECQKSSEEKLPGVSARSRSSVCSEGHESKKNVNFGLETKKSIIHPRSDSSNRSTRFSLSSEKSYPNGLCTPGQSGYVTNCPHTKEAIINDDIEKRVLVNKDGSLSVEMKVRFRLTNDETLQWSTEIKKSPGVTNDAINEKEANPHNLQQGKESSERESSGDVEETYAKVRHRRMEESHCENCCNHCQEYDIWKNPMHREHHRSSRLVKSSSSSASSHKIVRKEASVDSIRTVSRSSEEYTEHVVEKASCYQQTVDGGDTMVEYCTISRCCSRSEVCSMATTSKSKRSHAERGEGESRMLHNGERRPDTSERKHRHSGMCCVEVTKASDTEDRPVSAVSNSSKVLESLKEDEDDDDLPLGASRSTLCSQGATEIDNAEAEPTDTPAGQEVAQAAEEVNERSKSALSVASHTSKKSARAPSPRPKSSQNLLRELSGNTRPSSRVSSNVLREKENDKLETKSNKSSKSTHKKISSSQRDEQSSLELMQTCLPNTSPNDVVNEWLKNIPVDGPMYEMEDELAEPKDPPQVESVENAEETVQNESEQEVEEAAAAEENASESNVEKEHAPVEPEEDTAVEGDVAETSQAEESNTPKPNSDSPRKEQFPKRSHSTAQVMKALLSPKMDRCNSLPEVSPVYGRKLSKSAKGLLDCLAKLRLIDSDPTGTQNEKYSEIMTILQTLWLYDPTEGDQKTQRGKDHPPAEDEANPRSSSGVDVSSGSDESAKSMINGGEEKAASAPPTLVGEPLSDSEGHKEGAGSAEEGEVETPAEASPEEGGDEENGSVSAPEQAAEPEQEEAVQESPDDGEKNDEAGTENVPDDAPVELGESLESPKENEETVQSPTDSSGKESRSANGTESDRPDDSSSGTPPSVQRAQLSRKASQDPDPMWVLSLLKKIEKQFMSHYASAMAEFKVRWDLDDNVMLDTMINELKVEVHKRIQDSIKRELQKIQGRAGRSPRPPVNALSKEFSVQTDQRRRRLKVMRKQSLMPSKSEESDGASGTDNSDQRSDDEYCPCEACMQKKLEARQVLRAELINTAPVRMDFDLRKILQFKRDPPPAPKVEQTPAEPPKNQSESEVQDNEGGNLEAVQEEPEQEEEVLEENNAEEEGDEAGEKVDAEDEEKDGGDEIVVDGEDGGEEDEEENEAAASDEIVTGEVEEEEGEEAEETNENLETEEGDDEHTAEAEVAEEEAAEDEVEEVVADGSEEQDTANQQLSKDGTEDEAIAEKTPMDDTEGDVDCNQCDSTEAVDEIEEDVDEEIRNVCNEDGTEEATDAEGDATVQSDTGAEEASEGPQDQDEGDEDEEDTKVADLKPAKGESWEQFRNRQMTRTSVESQPGSMDSVELELEAKQIVQSVFSSISGHKMDRDETDEGLKITSKKRSRSPARANKPRRPKDSDIKVDDLEF
ncbi:retinitis pigmentosa 1-like 1 protein [Sardina pilchardus]|uniref:retinitis pigmentosa 1-like 1 protein n=1 Tax=Sardina pilchardus TaxID=27697 RepID=UPI002E146A6F